MIGRTISHYKILEKLGGGGMGVVYKAEDTKLERLVALKFLPPELTSDPAAKRRFVHEAKAASALQHNNICTIHEIDETYDGRLFICMDCYEGQTLKQKMTDGLLDVSEAIDIVSQVAEGLSKAHSAGMVHRDIKPANIVVTNDGVAKIVDFGLAKLAGRTRVTRTGATVGTVAYMSPEQARGDEVDARADMFSLGVVLYELLSGDQPFTTDFDAATVYNIMHKDPTPLSRYRNDLPEKLRRIVDRSLSKDAKDRYRNISEMHHDLELIRRRLETGSTTEDEKLIAPRRLTRRGRRIVTIAAIATVLIGPLLYFLSSGGDVPRLMVVKWENTSNLRELDWVAGAIMSGLILTLGDLEDHNVISRQTVAAAVAALGPATADAAPISFAAAEGVGASYLISGTLSRSGPWLHLDCELTDIGEGILVDSWWIEISDSNRIQAAIVGLAVDIAEALDAKWRRNPRDAEAGARPPTTSTAALRHYQQALEAEERGDIPTALENLRAAVGLDSTYAEAHFLLSKLTPDLTEERDHLTSAMKYRLQAPPMVRKLVEAQSVVVDKQISPAIEMYEEILREDPEQVRARKSLGQLYRRVRRFSDAAAEYEVLHRISPFDYSFYRDWAMTYAEIGRRDKAVELISDWRRQFPDQGPPLREYLYVCERLGLYQEGAALCDSLYDIDPLMPPYLCGWLYESVGRLNDAENVFMRLIDSPDASIASSRGYAYMAYLSYRKQQYEQGFDYIEKALEHHDEVYYHWLAGLIAAKAGQLERARTHAELVKREFHSLPDDSTAGEAVGHRRLYYHLLGCIDLADGQPARAAKWFEKTLSYTSGIDNPYFRTCFGRALMESGELDGAIAQFENVLRDNPEYPEVLLCLGKTYLLKEDYRRSGAVLAELKNLWKKADTDDPLNMELNRLMEVAAEHQ